MLRLVSSTSTPGCTTYGFLGSRSLTGGNLPALTLAAIIGDSRYWPAAGPVVGTSELLVPEASGRCVCVAEHAPTTAPAAATPKKPRRENPTSDIQPTFPSGTPRRAKFRSLLWSLFQSSHF